LPALSFIHKYKARPEPSVRNDPAELSLAVITVPDPAEPLDAAAGAAAALLPVLLPVLLLAEHAAAAGTMSSAAAIHIFFMQVATARSRRKPAGTV
jgi:hypothetical protein